MRGHIITFLEIPVRTDSGSPNKTIRIPDKNGGWYWSVCKEPVQQTIFSMAKSLEKHCC